MSNDIIDAVVHWLGYMILGSIAIVCVAAALAVLAISLSIAVQEIRSMFK